MPEGPEVRRVADYLQKRLPGLELVEIGWDQTGRYRGEGLPRYETFKKYLPMIITRVFTRGKNILFELKHSKDENIVFYIANHLIMTGKWLYEPTKHSNLWLVLGKYWNTKPRIRELIHLYFDDARHQGHVELYFSYSDLVQNKFNKKIGPDLLDAALTGVSLLQDWKISIKNTRRRNVEIKNYIKEQKHFSGIGNYLRAEILYESKISPFRKLKDLTNEEIELIYNKSLEIMKNSYLSHGLTISDYRDPEGFDGTYEVKIYNREEDPLGNKVVAHDKNNASKQTIYWVPEIQK